MRKSYALAMSAVTVLLLCAAGAFYAMYHKTSVQFAQLQTEEEHTRVRYGQAINEIATIQDSLNAIVLGADAARLIPSQLQGELQLSETRGDEALAKIAVLKAGIERTKARIQELDATLKRNGVKIAGLEKMIARLRQNVTEKEEQVALLNHSVDSLSTQVTGLTADVEDKRRELGTIYYAVGTKKDLTNSGIVVAKGGVLGVGKTLEPAKDANQMAFTPLDT